MNAEFLRWKTGSLSFPLTLACSSFTLNNVQKVIASLVTDVRVLLIDWRSIVGTIEVDLQIHEISFGHTHSLCSKRAQN